MQDLWNEVKTFKFSVGRVFAFLIVLVIYFKFLTINIYKLNVHEEIFNLQIHMISPDGSYELQQLGDYFTDGASSLQCVIPPNTWFALEMKDKTSYTLATSSCIPGIYCLVSFSSLSMMDIHIASC